MHMSRYFACHKMHIAIWLTFASFALAFASAVIFDLVWQVTFTLLFLLMVGEVFVLEAIQRKALKRIRAKLYTSCDPLGYAIDCEYCMQREKDFIQSFLFTVDLTEALIEMGDFENALAVADDNAPGGYSMPYFRCLYYTNITRILIYLGRANEVDEYYDFTHEQLKLIKGNADRLRINSYKILMEIEYAFMKGELDRVRSLTELFESQKNSPYLLVHLNLAKGRYCILTDSKETAKIHLNYVINNGKGLYAVAIARKLLREL